MSPQITAFKFDFFILTLRTVNGHLLTAIKLCRLESLRQIALNPHILCTNCAAMVGHIDIGYLLVSSVFGESTQKND